MQELETANQRLMAYYPGVLNRSRAALVSIPAEEKMVHADFPLQLQHMYSVRGYLHGPLDKVPVQIVLMSTNLNKLTLLDPVELGLMAHLNLRMCRQGTTQSLL